MKWENLIKREYGERFEYKCMEKRRKERAVRMHFNDNKWLKQNKSAKTKKQRVRVH